MYRCPYFYNYKMMITNKYLRMNDINLVLDTQNYYEIPKNSVKLLINKHTLNNAEFKS